MYLKKGGGRCRCGWRGTNLSWIRVVSLTRRPRARGHDAFVHRRLSVGGFVAIWLLRQLLHREGARAVRQVDGDTRWDWLAKVVVGQLQVFLVCCLFFEGAGSMR